jgi:hypothetical protein
MKTNQNILIIIITLVIITSCNSSKKTSFTAEQKEQLHQLVADKNFEINSDWAYPLPSTALSSIANSGLIAPGNTANQISLIGNTNSLIIKGDSIKAQLPYYGERRIVTNYNSTNIGIELNGLLKDLETDFDEQKKRYTLRFKANQDTENYDFRVIIFPNMRADINVNSTHRNNISYSGNVKVLD